MEQEKITGSVSRIIWQSGDERFSVFRFETESFDTSATLPCPPPPQGQTVELSGSWTVHPRFGRQFKAEGFRIVTPSDSEAIEKFLATGVVEGVGPAMARRLVAKFGEETLEVIAHEPHRLREVSGIGPKTAKKIHESYAEQAELKDIMLWLESHGIPSTLGAKLFKVYGSLAIEIIEKNPYRLADDVQGIGFVTADNIARNLGWEADSPDRLEAGLASVLNGISMDGHVCIPEEELLNRTVRFLGLRREIVAEAVRAARNNGDIPCETVGDTDYYYPPFLYEAEVETAQRLAELDRAARTLSVESPAEMVEDWEAKNGTQLSDGQREAMVAALSYGVFCLTGGPGTGKTTVVRGILDLLKSNGMRVLLAAPTGRAAKRLSEATGASAATLHRLLEANAGATGSMFGKDEDDPLEANAIIVDEASMIDIVLMQHLLAAVPPGCHIIFVGDAAQLPAVGPGLVLRDIIRSGAVPTVRLTEIFRQAAESPIVMNAHAINQGRLPAVTEQLDDGFAHIVIDNEPGVAACLVDLAVRALPERGYDPWTDIQILSPMHRGECGVAALNARLQAVLNPPGFHVSEVHYGEVVFREGDKVMQLRNDYEKEVFNGDIGRIIHITQDGLTILFDGERPVKYEKNEMKDLALAYAMTVHKSQGSEYPVVLMPLVDSHFVMLRRTLLYTAVTRAKDRVVLVGTKRAFYTAVTDDRTDRRYTLLTERLTNSL